MDNKLQELTNKLYQEGLVKGRTDAEALLAKAREEAAALLANAKEEAARILEDARKQALEHKEQVANEVRMASRLTVSQLKQEVAQLVVMNVLEEPTQAAMTHNDFIESLIKTLVERFNPNGAQAMDLEVVLPQAQKEGFASFLKTQVARLFNHNLSFSFATDLDNGFTIGPKDGAYRISFTDRDFIALFSKYLRPATEQLIYGK